MNHGKTEARDILLKAAKIVELDAVDATLIRHGSHAMYVLPGHVVARIGARGTVETARREVWASQWLAGRGLTVTEVVRELTQPVLVEGRPVTWWRQLPEHRAGTPAELGAVLRRLHDLQGPFPSELPISDPFRGLATRISSASKLTEPDRRWLAGHLADLRDRHGELCMTSPHRVIHGDAWQGNVAVPDSGDPVLLDLENIAVGHREWDLVQIAVDYADFARLTMADYRSFVDAYGGYDVMSFPGFRVLADIQELRWVCFVASKADGSTEAVREVRHRMACLRGDVDRPWSWTAF